MGMVALLYEQERPRELEPGDYIMGINAHTLDGRSQKYFFGPFAGLGEDPERIFVFLRPDCSYCVWEFDLWNDLARTGTFFEEMIGVSLGSAADTDSFVHEHQVSFPIVVGDPSLLRQLHLPGVPSLIRVSDSGRVEDVFFGRLRSGDIVRLVSDPIEDENQ